MSVIGKLDEQVDATFITPLTTTRPPDEKVAPVSLPAPATPDDALAAVTTTTNHTRPHAEPAAHDDAPRRAVVFPVWML